MFVFLGFSWIFMAAAVLSNAVRYTRATTEQQRMTALHDALVLWAIALLLCLAAAAIDPNLGKHLYRALPSLSGSLMPHQKSGIGFPNVTGGHTMFVKTVFLAMLAAALQAQTLNVPTTSGTDKVTAFIGPNLILTEGLPKVAFSYGCVAYGINNRVDAYGCVTHTTTTGRTQFTATPGFNVNFIKSKYGNLGTFQLLNVPVNRRGDGAVTYFAALLGSWDLKVKKFAYSPYVGLSSLVPLGQAAGKLFTPPDPVLNVPVGIAVPVGKLTFLAEYGIPVRFRGSATKTVGVGLAYTVR